MVVSPIGIFGEGQKSKVFQESEHRYKVVNVPLTSRAINLAKTRQRHLLHFTLKGSIGKGRERGHFILEFRQLENLVFCPLDCLPITCELMSLRSSF